MVLSLSYDYVSKLAYVFYDQFMFTMTGFWVKTSSQKASNSNEKLFKSGYSVIF